MELTLTIWSAMSFGEQAVAVVLAIPVAWLLSKVAYGLGYVLGQLISLFL
jgi:hypothetical protein